MNELSPGFLVAVKAYIRTRIDVMSNTDRIFKMLDRIKNNNAENSFVFDTVSDVSSYVDGGEYLMAIELLLDNLYDVDGYIDETTQADILYLAKLYEIDLSFWSQYFDWIN